jgi:hypothetical protein
VRGTVSSREMRKGDWNAYVHKHVRAAFHSAALRLACSGRHGAALAGPVLNTTRQASWLSFSWRHALSDWICSMQSANLGVRG